MQESHNILIKSKELVRRVNAYFKIRNLENKRLSLLKEYHAVLDLSGEIVFHLIKVQMFEVRLTRADGSKFPLSLRLALLNNENGEKSVLGMGQDLSNLKWLKEELTGKNQSSSC